MRFIDYSNTARLAELERAAYLAGDTAQATALATIMNQQETVQETENAITDRTERTGALLTALDEFLCGFSTLQDDVAGMVNLKTKAERNTAWQEWDKQVEAMLDDLRKAYATADAD